MGRAAVTPPADDGRHTGEVSPSLPPGIGRLFDTVAEEYDDLRPHYPPPLFDDLTAIAHLDPGARVLEIGCGTGIATRDLLARGLVIDAVEPGREMAAVARREAPGLPLQVHVSTFEGWTPEPEPYELVFSATAFHWVDPAVRWEKTADVLRSGGYLALATNRTVRGGSFQQLEELSDDLRRRYAPDMVDEGPSPSAASFRARMAAASGDIGTLWGVADPKGGASPARDLYEPPEVRTYRWDQPYGREAAIRLLATYSPYLALPEGGRRALLAGMGRLVDERFGGTVVRRYLSILAVARRARR